MSGGYVQADLTELENFVKHLHTASVKFKKDMAAFLDGVGFAAAETDFWSSVAHSK